MTATDDVQHFADHEESLLAVIEGVAAADDAVWEHLATCGTCLAAVARTAAATVIAVGPAHGYALGRELARGGMGRVLLGHDAQLQREVAIKLAQPAAHAEQRVQREIELTARLQHPNILPVYAAGTLDGAAFFAMRPVRGQPLDERIRAAKTREQRSRLVPHVLAVIDAIAYAHAHGIIHRDLEPANVLVGEHGELVVIGWGRGARVGGTETATVEDMRTDVLALGGMLFETLADVRVSSDSRGRELPPVLRAIIAKATAPAPSARYADAGELGAELRRYTAGLLVDAHRDPWPTRLVRWFRRRPAP